MDGALKWSCPRLDVAKLADGSVLKTEFLRVSERRGGGV
jgi:hypothetical protein